jgi:flagellar hook-basal body complex protein FliE|tara:strand:- start:1803 stop:2078 length:276 start_codon:yes stop_codon:yes gene_type:complete
MGQMPGGVGGSAQQQGQNSPDFKAVLMGNLKEVNALQQDATQAAEDLITGKRDDIEGVIAATDKADTAFKMLQAMRNQVMQAYDEVKQMRV